MTGLTLERTRLDSQGRFAGTGEPHTIDAQLVLRSVGYQSVPLPGLPFHDATHTVPHLEGRVIGPDGSALPGEYVAGWLKRGPTGVIGTNKSDAAETVRSLLADLAGGPGPGDVPLPRAGLLPMPPGPGGGARAGGFGRGLPACWPGAAWPVSYADWLGMRRPRRSSAWRSAAGRG